jgi:hypothetical protein
MANYIVRAEKFRCDDESGFDIFGSDEPFWVFTAKTDAGGADTTRSEVFGDVDSGDTRRLDTKNNRNVVWPRRGQVTGAPGPIGLSIQLWESDQGNADDIAKQTEIALDIAAGTVAPWAGLVPGVVRNQIAKFLGDDLMGSRTVLLRASQLRARLKNVGDSMPLVLKFSGQSGDLPFDVAGGPDYTLHLRVVRTA